MNTRRLRIAYLCDITPLDPNLYSGGNARIYGALQKHVGDVTILPQSWHAAEPLRRLMHRMPEAINLRARWRLHLALGRMIAPGVRRAVRRGDFDVLFCAYSIQSLAGVGRIPGVVTAFTADATQTIYKQSEVGQAFQSMLSVSRYFDPWVARQEAKVLADVDELLWPTEWLRSGASDLLGVPKDKGQVIPWGANIDWMERRDPEPLAKGGPVRLLFVGRDWFAKGGPLAREVLGLLRARGVDARLSVIGTHPPQEHIAEGMDVIGPLDKSNAKEMSRFSDAFRNAHFLINPSFESYGFAYCEAAAYGLPALSLRVGGVPVRDGVNGHALPAESNADDFARVVQGYLERPHDHAALQQSSRREYETSLNWDAWGQRVSAVLQNAVAKA